MINLENYLKKLNETNSEYSVEDIIEAFEFAKAAHLGQKRKSGEDFFCHPIAVSLILAELRMEEEMIIAALLHDVVEDTEYTYEDINDRFGPSVALLVDGVTKLGKIHYESKEEMQAENLRKMFLAMAKDIRVVLIKLADRLHNLRTLGAMPEHKKKEKALETLEIYAPIAHRLGISKIKWELEDISFSHLYPNEYRDLVEKINTKRSEREETINNNIELLKEKINSSITKDFEIYGRAKHFYSIYKKMVNKNKKFDEIFDLTAVRIVVDSMKDCYAILGICHTLWRPIPGRFKDYIAMPKSNMYQSLHTTVITPSGDTIEIQIRTEEMHKIAEYGIAAHWIYKGSKSVPKESMEKKLKWIDQIMEWQNDMSDPTQFIDSIKVDLYENEVFVFTPKGDVYELPSGSTPLDFAYKIHSMVGHECVGAKVNGSIVPLTYTLSTGEIVSIITKKHSGPSRDWLDVAQSNNAKNKIKRWFKKESKQENIEKGKAMLEKSMKRAHLSMKDDFKIQWVLPILKRLSLDTSEDLYEAIGYGGILLKQVIPKIREEKVKEEKKNNPVKINNKPYQQKINRGHMGIVVDGLDGALIRFAKCCNPLPGDNIIGYVTTGRGVAIHRVDCPNFKDLEKSKDRFIEVHWHDYEKTSYEAKIRIVADDRRGLLSEVTMIINDENFVVNGLNAKKEKGDMANIEIVLEIDNKDHLTKLMNRLKKIQGLIEITRVVN